MNTHMRTARIAGLLYLVYIVVSIASDVIGRSKILVSGDAATTAQNIIASEWQFRSIGFIGDLVSALLFLLTAWALYVLLQPVNKNIALLFLLLNLGGVAVQCFSDLGLAAGLLLLSGSDYLKVFQGEQLQAMSMFFLDLRQNGFMMAQLFYGAWLLPLGYLVFKSGFLPRILGVVLMVHCVVWLTRFLQFFLFPDVETITYIAYAVGFVAELGLGLWLLIMGAKEQKPAMVAVG